MPIPGTTRPERLNENIRAIDVELTLEELAAITSASAGKKIAGERYGESSEKLIRLDPGFTLF